MRLKSTFILALCACSAVGMLFGQKWWEKKPFRDWSTREVRRMLDRSPWSEVRTITVIPPRYAMGMEAEERLNHFHLRFLTAKPIRLALAREMKLQAHQRLAPTALERFIQSTDDQFIVLLMTLSADPPGAVSISQYRSKLLSLGTPDLSDVTFLATRTGKRAYLARYEPEGPDGLGAKFYFPLAGTVRLPYPTETSLPFS